MEATQRKLVSLAVAIVVTAFFAGRAAGQSSFSKKRSHSVDSLRIRRAFQSATEAGFSTPQTASS